MALDPIKFKVIAATAMAMEYRRPFSWIINRASARIVATEVQAGVYLNYSQDFFQRYKM